MQLRHVLSTFAVSAAVVLTAPNAVAAPAPDPIVSGLAGPLQFDYASARGLFVAQAFSGTLTKVRADGSTVDLLNEPGLSGVATRGDRLVYTVNNDPEGGGASTEVLKRRYRNGDTKVLADLGAYERRVNPDKGNTYGLRGLSEECAAQVPPDFLPAKGAVDSNPYSVAWGRDGWYVADAGANAIYRVARSGRISVAYVAKPQLTTVNAATAAAFELPDCVVGKQFAFEPVPTDVELDRGSLVVSLLPGGPEADSPLGPRGAVIRVNPRTHRAHRLANGFAGATNVAVGQHGKIFVTELFGNKISSIRRGQVETVAELPSPAAVEVARGTLYAAIDAFGDGKIVRVPR